MRQRSRQSDSRSPERRALTVSGASCPVNNLLRKVLYSQGRILGQDVGVDLRCLGRAAAELLLNAADIDVRSDLMPPENWSKVNARIGRKRGRDVEGKARRSWPTDTPDSSGACRRPGLLAQLPSPQPRRSRGRQSHSPRPHLP